MRIYEEHIPFFDREIERVGKPPFHLSAGSFLAVLAQEHGSREADAACRVFAATLEWPEMTEPVRLEVNLRLACARWWCTVVPDGEVSEEEPGPLFLERLLIEYWQDVGRKDWIYESILGFSGSGFVPGEAQSS
jgi:hypothetical protein